MSWYKALSPLPINKFVDDITAFVKPRVASQVDQLGKNLTNIITLDFVEQSNNTKTFHNEILQLFKFPTKTQIKILLKDYATFSKFGFLPSINLINLLEWGNLYENLTPKKLKESVDEAIHILLQHSGLPEHIEEHGFDPEKSQAIAYNFLEKVFYTQDFDKYGPIEDIDDAKITQMYDDFITQNPTYYAGTPQK